MIEVYSGGSCRVDWTVYRSGCDNVTEDFRRSDLKVLLSSDKGRMLVPFSELDGVLSVDIPSDLPVGVYGLQALWVKNGNHDCRLRCVSRSDKPNLFAVVSGIPPEGTAVIHTCSHVRTFGYDGLDAYELAVLLGKTIYSEDVWLHPIESLDGLSKEVEELKSNLEKEIEDVRKDVDSAFQDIGSAFEEFAGDVEKNYSKKSETIKELSLGSIQGTDSVEVRLEGQYSDSHEGSHLVMNNVILPPATSSKAGVMSSWDKAQVDKISDIEKNTTNAYSKAEIDKKIGDINSILDLVKYEQLEIQIQGALPDREFIGEGEIMSGAKPGLGQSVTVLLEYPAAYESIVVPLIPAIEEGACQTWIGLYTVLNSSMKVEITFGPTGNIVKVVQCLANVIKNDQFFNDGTNELVPVKHPDLSTQPSILPYKFAGNYVYEQMVWVDGSRFIGNVYEIDLIRFDDYKQNGENNIILDRHFFIVGDSFNGNFTPLGPDWFNFEMLSDDKRIFLRRVGSTLPVCKGAWIRVVWTSEPKSGGYYYAQEDKQEDKLTFNDITNGRIMYMYDADGNRYYPEPGKIVIDSKGRELLLQGGWLKWCGSAEVNVVYIYYKGDRRYWYKDQPLYLSFPSGGDQNGIALDSILGSTIQEFIAGTYSVQIIP